MDSNKNNLGRNPGETSDSIWDRPSDWIVNSDKEKKKEEEEKRQKEAAETKAKEEAKKKAEKEAADKKAEEEEKKKTEADEKAAQEEEDEKTRDEEENEERKRKLTLLRQNILGMAAVGVLTQSLQKLWRLLQRRRKVEVADDGRILTTDDNDEVVDLSQLTYKAQAETERWDERLPNAQIPDAGVLDQEVLRGEQMDETTNDLEIERADYVGGKVTDLSDLPADSLSSQEDFSEQDDRRFERPRSGDESLGQSATKDERADRSQTKDERPTSTEKKPWEPWKFFDKAEKPADKKESPKEKQPDSSRMTAKEGSPSGAERSTASDNDIRKAAEKILDRLNSEEAKILRDSSGPSRDYLARLLRQKLDGKVELKASDLDRLSRLLREELRKPMEKTSHPAQDSVGGAVGGGGVASSSVAANSLGAGSGAGLSAGGQSAGAADSRVLSSFTGAGVGSGSTGSSSPIAGGEDALSTHDGSGGSRQSRSNNNGEVDWSSLLPGSPNGESAGGFAAEPEVANGSNAAPGSNKPSSISSPSYSPEFGKDGSSVAGLSTLPDQSVSSSSSTTSAGSGGSSSVRSAESLSASNSVGGKSSFSGGNLNPTTRGGFGSSSGGYGSSRAGATSSPNPAGRTVANDNKESSKSAGRSTLAMPPDFSGLTSLFGGFGSIGRGLSRSGRARAENLSDQVATRLSSSGEQFSTPQTKAEQRAMARDVGLLNAMRELYLLAVAAGAVLPNQNLLQPDVRQINETRDVRDDAAQEQDSATVSGNDAVSDQVSSAVAADDSAMVSSDDSTQDQSLTSTADDATDDQIPVAAATEDSSLDEAGYLAALIVLSSFREGKKSTSRTVI